MNTKQDDWWNWTLKKLKIYIKCLQFSVLVRQYDINAIKS